MRFFFAWTFLGLQSYEVWILLIGALASAAAGLIGCFLILRKMALMGDAISHAVLPGIALAVLLTGHMSPIAIILGAGAFGVLTPYLIDSLKKSGRVQEDASIGVVFTMLFSIGVILIANMGNVDLDVDCVLFGEIATTPFDTWTLYGIQLGPRAFWALASVFLLNVGFITLLYKELKISTFDQSLARAMGLRPRLIHYLLLGLVALTSIAAFESVGAIIVVAMLIAPGATAYLLTDRLSVMLTLSAILGALAAILGYASSLALGGKVSISGCISSAAGGLFALAFFLSPRYGLIVRLWRRTRLSRRLAREHILSTLYRLHEQKQTWLSFPELLELHQEHPKLIQRSAAQLMRAGLILWENDQLRLTPSGETHAASLVRAHRLWETYLEQRLGLPPDHVHRSADDMEHFLSPELQNKLIQALEHPERDPHGKPIPGLPPPPRKP